MLRNTKRNTEAIEKVLRTGLNITYLETMTKFLNLQTVIRAHGEIGGVIVKKEMINTNINVRWVNHSERKLSVKKK